LSHARKHLGIVFVISLLLNDGETALEAVGRGGFDCVLTRQGALVVSEDGATISVDSSQTAVEGFYNCCDPGIAEGAAARLVPEPLAPVVQPLSVTAARFGSVPKTYVGARRDRWCPGRCSSA
jgi:hypothetical protein